MLKHFRNIFFRIKRSELCLWRKKSRWQKISFDYRRSRQEGDKPTNTQKYIGNRREREDRKWFFLRHRSYRPILSIAFLPLWQSYLFVMLFSELFRFSSDLDMPLWYGDRQNLQRHHSQESVELLRLSNDRGTSLVGDTNNSSSFWPALKIVGKFMVSFIAFCQDCTKMEGITRISSLHQCK